MSGGAGEWELEYPIISGDSSRGPMFEPREMGGELMLQLFGKGGNAHYEPYWCELNGHVRCFFPFFCGVSRRGAARPSTCISTSRTRRHVCALISKRFAAVAGGLPMDLPMGR